MRKVYIATIQVAVDAVNEGAAADGISEGMRGLFVDWQYLKVGGQFLYPVEKFIAADVIEEGEAFA